MSTKSVSLESLSLRELSDGESEKVRGGFSDQAELDQYALQFSAGRPSSVKISFNPNFKIPKDNDN
jgi:hypothetical protein